MAAASGENPVFVADGPIGDDESQTFGIQMSDLPALLPSAVSDYEGLLIDFCLPTGFRIIAVSALGWSFVNGGDDYDGGDAYVFNTDAITAGTDAFVGVVIEKDPALGDVSGIMEADVVVGSTGIAVPTLYWPFEFGADGTSINCGAPSRRG